MSYRNISFHEILLIPLMEVPDRVGTGVLLDPHVQRGFPVVVLQSDHGVSLRCHGSPEYGHGERGQHPGLQRRGRQ